MGHVDGNQGIAHDCTPSGMSPIVEHKSLSHNKLAIFRVVVSLTLKMANYLITSRLCTTPHTQHR